MTNVACLIRSRTLRLGGAAQRSGRICRWPCRREGYLDGLRLTTAAVNLRRLHELA